MTDTIRTQGYLLGTEFPDNQIATISAQYVRDFVVSTPSLANTPNSVANILDYGADSTGVADSTTAIRNAIASGAHCIYIPAGHFLVTDALTLSAGQSIVGCKRQAILTITNAFNMSALGVIVLAAAEQAASVVDLWIRFTQPNTGGMIRSAIVQYPAGIYAVASSRFKVVDVIISNAWVGINGGASGGSFIERFECSAYSQGMVWAAALDYVHISNYHFWNFDMTSNQLAVFQDGTTVAAQLGRIDGLLATNWGIAEGIINVTSTTGTAGWYVFSNLQMDGPLSQLNIAASINFVGVNVEFTRGSSDTMAAIVVSGGHNTFTNLTYAGTMPTIAPIQVTGGFALFNGGVLTQDATGASLATVTAGSLICRDTYLITHNNAHTVAWFHQSGTGVLVIDGAFFPIAATGVAIQMDTNVAGNHVGDNYYGASTLTIPATTSTLQLIGKLLAPTLQGTTTYADDTAAAAGGVAIGQLYRNGSVVQMRIS